MEPPSSPALRNPKAPSCRVCRAPRGRKGGAFAEFSTDFRLLISSDISCWSEKKRAGGRGDWGTGCWRQCAIQGAIQGPVGRGLLLGTRIAPPTAIPPCTPLLAETQPEKGLAVARVSGDSRDPGRVGRGAETRVTAVSARRGDTGGRGGGVGGAAERAGGGTGI